MTNILALGQEKMYNIKRYKNLFIVFISIIFFCHNAYAYSIIRDTEIEDAIHEAINPIIQNSKVKKSFIKLFIINDTSINAFATSNGYIFINSGLLLKYSDPEVISGVFAHELGHIESGHIARIKDQFKNAQYGMIGTMIFGGLISLASPEAGIGIIASGAHMAERTALSYSRQNEIQADQMAIRYLNKANISSDGLLKLLKDLSQKENIHNLKNYQYSFTHPLSRDRLEFITQNKHQFQKNPLLDSSLKNRFAKAIIKLDCFTLKPEKLIAKYPNNDFVKSIYLFRTKKYNSSILLLNEVIKKNPNDPYLFDLKGEMLFEMGKLDESLIAYNKAAKSLKNKPILNYQLGLIHLRKFEETKEKSYIENAIYHFLKSHNIEKENPEYLKQLSISYGKINNLGLAYLFRCKEYLTLDNKDQALKYAKLAEKTLPPSNNSARLEIKDIILSLNDNIK